MADSQKLNIVDERGNIIGEETRAHIHEQGLLHREIHIWFFTPHGDVIFQHRGKAKDTYPDLLDATVGGHVEIGSDYERAALQEMEEETGVRADKSRLIFMQLTRNKKFDATTKMTNNVIRAVYAYRYDGTAEDLRVEEGAEGFEAWPLEKLFHISDEDRTRFIPLTFEPQTLDIFEKIRKL